MKIKERIRWPDNHTITKIKFAWLPVQAVKQIHTSDEPKLVWLWLERYLKISKYRRLPGPGDFWSVRKEAM